MSNETYKTEIFGEEVFLIADWSQSASSILLKFGDGDSYCTGQQVAYFGHNKYSAIRHYLEEYLAECGDNPEDFQAEIEAAVDAMVEVDDHHHRPTTPRP